MNAANGVSMNPDLIRTKLETLRRCLARLREKTPPSVDALLDDIDAQDIICINLERAVQSCVDITVHLLADYDEPAPQSMASTFLTLHRRGVLTDDLAHQMMKAVGFRNIAVHEYANLDWQIVYGIVTERLDDFAAFARAIEAYMLKNINAGPSNTN